MKSSSPERKAQQEEKEPEKEPENMSSSRSSVNPKTREEPSHGSVYEELLNAKEIQDNPLNIPITSGPDASPQPSASSGPGTEVPEPDPSTRRQTWVGPEVARSSGQGQSTRPPPAAQSYGQFQEESLTYDNMSVQAVAEPLTSAYDPVAAAQIVSETRPAPTENENKRNGEQEEQEVELARLKLRHQRYKLVKLSILLAILIIVTAVPLSIRNQRLAAESSTPDVSPCFQTREELESAVDDYLAGGARRDGAVTAYGNPIGSWCVSLLQGMDLLFSALRNPNAASFDDPLFYWDVSRVVSMRQMFQGAAAFSQPLGSWNVSAVANMTMMFTGASRFRQDLCAWRALLSKETLVSDMFLDTACDSQEDPELGPSANGSFCTPCKT